MMQLQIFLIAITLKPAFKKISNSFYRLHDYKFNLKAFLNIQILKKGKEMKTTMTETNILNE